MNPDTIAAERSPQAQPGTPASATSIPSAEIEVTELLRGVTGLPAAALAAAT